jgi:hypothetical protein
VKEPGSAARGLLLLLVIGRPDELCSRFTLNERARYELLGLKKPG